ncbi:uncharacterized protein TNCV_1326551 [Trichonephila clavipes]|nr:uncharacterized protein TNCV_1326551 [Trichonephila clavipes]
MNPCSVCSTRVWKDRGERTLAVSISLRHAGPSPGVMEWDAIGNTYRSPLVCIDGTLKNAYYISGVFRSVSFHFIRVLQNPTFQHSMLPFCTDLP